MCVNTAKCAVSNRFSVDQSMATTDEKVTGPRSMHQSEAVARISNTD